jgi:hypothetical protein
MSTPKRKFVSTPKRIHQAIDCMSTFKSFIIDNGNPVLLEKFYDFERHFNATSSHSNTMQSTLDSFFIK